MKKLKKNVYYVIYIFQIVFNAIAKQFVLDAKIRNT